jgi:hypothetical protein
MVTNSFGTLKFHAPNGKALSMHPKCLDFFSFKFWVGEIFFLLSYVPNMLFFKFPMGSQYVP